MTVRRPSRGATFVALGIGALALAGAGPAAGQSKCLAIQFKAAGGAAKAKFTCRARAAKAGKPVDQACIAAADAALARKWTKAGRRGDCAATGVAAEGARATDRCLAGIEDVVDPPPPASSLCCNLGGSCAHGLDEDGCTAVFGGTIGPAGSVCDGATGACSLSSIGTGRCCMAADGGFCEAGPSLDLSGCAPPTFLDFPFSSTCAPSGSCTFP